MKRLLYLFLALAAVMAWRDWQNRPIQHAPGVLVPSAPQQQAVAAAEPFVLNGYQITRRAAFSLHARVLSRENYYLGAEADLSPMDLALGWRPMSDQAVLDRIEISQSGRWYFTRYELPAPLPDAAIIRNSSNMHMLPANEWAADKLGDIREGDLVFLRGFLVDVDHPSGFRWRTSLRRDDTGNGSCEIFYVEYVEIEPR
jgi:hypothetical protein